MLDLFVESSENITELLKEAYQDTRYMLYIIYKNMKWLCIYYIYTHILELNDFSYE